MNDTINDDPINQIMEITIEKGFIRRIKSPFSNSFFPTCFELVGGNIQERAGGLQVPQVRSGIEFYSGINSFWPT